MLYQEDITRIQRIHVLLIDILFTQKWIYRIDTQTIETTSIVTNKIYKPNKHQISYVSCAFCAMKARICSISRLVSVSCWH
jgi:hypothetical protein